MTVIVSPRAHPVGRALAALRAHARPRAVISLAIAAAVAVAAIAATLGAQRSNSSGGGRVGQARPTASAAAQEAYRYPLGCLGVTIDNPAKAAAERRLGHTGPCWHYGVYLTAVLRQVDGVWRLALDARSDSCPHVWLPAAVRAQLPTCTKIAGTPPHRPH